MKLKPTILLFFSLNVCILINAQIVNNGILKIESSTIVYFQNEYTNTSLGNHVSDGNLYLNNHFINHGLTSATAGTTYFKSATNTLLTLSGTSEDANFYNLEIDITAVNKKGLSVADNLSLQVANALNFNSGDLRLTGDSQLIQSHLGVNINSVVSGKLLVDQQGNVSPYQYDYWSSPVNNNGTFSLLGEKFDGSDSSMNPFNPTQVLFNSGTPYNGLPSVIDGSGNVTTALTINTRWLYKYARDTGSYSQWIQLTNSSDLIPGEGYTMKGTDAATPNQNYVYYGAPNNGYYEFPITLEENILLGNPYPSALDIDKFLIDNIAVLDALYFWVDGGSTSHALSNYYGGYAIRNITGGTPPSIASSLISGIGDAGTVTPPSRYMPIGKGFFIEAIGSGNIKFDNSQRVFSVENARLSSNESNKYIRIGYEGPEGFHRQMLLGFLPNTTADLSYNIGYDAVQFMTRDNDAFFVIDGNIDKRYAIQGANDYSEFMEFPIGLLISESGPHHLMLDSVENFTETIYLKDNILNITHNLSDSNFVLNLPTGEYLDRYSLVFIPSETLSTTTSELDQTLVYYNGQDQIVITKPMHLEIESIDIYNILGQHMVSFAENQTNQTKIHVPFNASKGVYLVILNTNNSQKSTKILKY